MRDAAAWKEFLSRFELLIHRCIHRVTSRFGPLVDSEGHREIYATFLLELNRRDMHKLRIFNPSRGMQFGSWLGMLANRCAHDFLRKTSREPTHTPLNEARWISGEGKTPQHALLRKERWREVNRALHAFSERDQNFVRLYYFKGLSAQDVADRLQVSVNTVYSKKHKIQARLRSALMSEQSANR